MFSFNSLINFFFLLKHRKNFKNWKKRNFQSPSPDFIKHQILKNNNLKNSLWIETGTYYGETTHFLSKIAKKVITIEADKRLAKIAKSRFIKNKNIEVVYGKSEQVLESILTQKKYFKNLCIYLDAHLCTDHVTSLKTFGTDNYGTPIIRELNIIKKNLTKITNLRILIDDIRLFDKNFQNYPKKIKLIEWCEKNRYQWNIEHDILIIRNK